MQICFCAPDTSIDASELNRIKVRSQQRRLAGEEHEARWADSESDSRARYLDTGKLGGRFGLKGSDDVYRVRIALLAGAAPVSPERTREFIRSLRRSGVEVEIVTCPGSMGEDFAREEYDPLLVELQIKSITSSSDTKRAAALMVEMAVDLLVFVGGDGTARDIFEAIDEKTTVLGVPSGVKMHSSVFALDPRRAAEVAVRYLRGEILTAKGEVLDVDEDKFRSGRVDVRLHGYMKIPSDQAYVQSAKAASLSTEEETEDQRAIARHLVEEMSDSTIYVVGPGTTTKAIFDELGLEKTILGVDMTLGMKILAKDADEKTILRELDAHGEAKIIVTPIGGQGFILGRGNQQISTDVIRKVGTENLIIVATPGKISALRDAQLHVDTGDPELDIALGGYRRVLVSYNEEMVVKIT